MIDDPRSKTKGEMEKNKLSLLDVSTYDVVTIIFLLPFFTSSSTPAVYETFLFVFFLFNDLRNVSCGGDYMWTDFPFEKTHFHLQERVVTDTEQQYTNNDGGRCRQRRLYIEQTDAATDKTTGACVCA